MWIRIGPLEVGRDLTQDLRRWHLTFRVDGALYYSTATYSDAQVEGQLSALAARVHGLLDQAGRPGEHPTMVTSEDAYPRRGAPVDLGDDPDGDLAGYDGRR
jgi:hypothetical protein